MELPLPSNWMDRLEQLRREQNPEPPRPALQLPVPTPPPEEDDTEREEAPRVIILDL
jgi:hypothetical protein